MDDPSAGTSGTADGGSAPQESGTGVGLGDLFFNPIGALFNLVVCLCCCSCGCFLLIIVFILSLFGLINFATPKPVDTVFEKWAVVCDAPLCSNVAKEMFAKNGAVGDAAVAVLLCMGVTAPHLTGIGGGLMAVWYDKSTKKVQALDALGMSSKNLKEDMFAANTSALKLGASAPIVPGAVAGYQALHSKTGKLNWKDLFEPAIRLAKEGFTIGAHLATALANNEKVLNVSAALRKRFSNTATGALLRKGDKLVQPQLADLLAKLAEGKADYFYKNELADEIEKAISAEGGVLNKADLSEYQPVWQDPVTGKMGDEKRIHSAPIPGAGTIVAAAVHKIRVQNPSLEEIEAILPTMSHARIHHFVEALKFSLAKRPELGDVKDAKDKESSMVADIIGYAVQNYDKKRPLSSASEYGIKYAPEEDLGGAHMTIVGPSGDALSITSGLNGMFGSGFMTASGVLFNNYMDAFAKPGKQFGLDMSPANQIGPSKRPMTSMVPSIITASNTPSDLVGAFGSSGGLPGISALAQLITCTRKYALPRCVWNDSLVQPTFRSTTPNTVFTEPKRKEFDPASMLRKLGNSVTEKQILASATGIIATKSRSWLAPNDTRRVDGSHAGE